MPTLSKQTFLVARKAALQKRLDVLDKCFLLMRPGDFPRYVKPIKAVTPWTCQISGKKIFPGDYVFPCNINPIVLNPTGRARCLVEEANPISAYLPTNTITVSLPILEDLVDIAQIHKLENETRQRLQDAATKLLKVHRHG